MAQAQMQVLIPSGTGIPADRSMNTWDFQVPDHSNATIAAINAALLDFYVSTPTGGTGSIVSRMRAGIVPSPWTFRYLSRDLATGVLTPVSESSATITGFAASGDAMPTEVAVRLSLHGALTGVQAVDRRRRGGPYLGPGWLADIGFVSSGTMRIDAALCEDISRAEGDLWDALDADTITPVIWSQADLSSWAVVGWFVDNAFDVIRSRGTAANVRVSDSRP